MKVVLRRTKIKNPPILLAHDERLFCSGQFCAEPYFSALFQLQFLMQTFRHFFSLFIFLAAANALSAQCGPSQYTVRLEIDPDYYWQEVSWAITNADGSATYAQGDCQGPDAAIYTYCVDSGACVVFRMYDSYGDGIAPDGIYRLYVNNVLMRENIGGNYGFNENTTFGCPPGAGCATALPIPDTGIYVSPIVGQTWYHFTPPANGTYSLSTCLPQNTCPTKIWVYGQCGGITLSNNQLGADFYAEDGCTGGALATLYLAGGSTYYFRFNYSTGDCGGAPIHFNLQYGGPIAGCTDPSACNYNPLASVSDTCIYPGNPDCPDAPDLVVLENVMRNSLEFNVLNNPDDCAVQEGCLRGLGNRYIVRFTTHIKNIGSQDYYIGEPPANINASSDQFIWDPCHNHWHYRGYAEYILFDAAGNRIPVGSKNGFCVLDLECSDGGSPQYSCGNMGIAAGCGDIYDASLPCQWVDITDLPAGAYTLVMRVNWDKSPDKIGRLEKSYENNWAQSCFVLSYDGNTPEVDFVNDCPQYTDCTGETFGDAQADCNGVCNGSAVRGDIDQDLARTPDDVQEYLAAALDDDLLPSECTDLFDDGLYDIYDAALLQECNLHGDDPQYWLLRFPCQFPTGFENTEDILYLLPGTLDTDAKTFDIQIVNPYNKVLGYQFNVSGLTIDSVENLAADFVADIRFDAATGEILALSATENAVNKNILPGNLLRVHYSELTGSEVCVASITTVVNSKYQRSEALLAEPNCVSTSSVAADEPGRPAFGVFVQPNPFRERTTVFFENADNEPMRVTLSDLTGRVVRVFDGVRGQEATFQRGDLAEGAYIFTVSGSRGSVSGKVIVQ
jgi:hypothetical protein